MGKYKNERANWAANNLENANQRLDDLFEKRNETTNLETVRTDHGYRRYYRSNVSDRMIDAQIDYIDRAEEILQDAVAEAHYESMEGHAWRRNNPGK